MAGVAVVIAEADRLARTKRPGEQADMVPGAPLELMAMAGNSCTTERKMLQGDLAPRRRLSHGFAFEAGSRALWEFAEKFPVSRKGT
jgi:hypothetical protein